MSLSQQGISLSQLFIGLVTSIDIAPFFRRWYFFSGQLLCDNGHCSHGNNTHVIEVTAGSSSLMKVDRVRVARSGGVGPDNLSVPINYLLPSAFPFPICFRALCQTSCLWQWGGKITLMRVQPT